MHVRQSFPYALYSPIRHRTGPLEMQSFMSKSGMVPALRLLYAQEKDVYFLQLGTSAAHEGEDVPDQKWQ